MPGPRVPIVPRVALGLVVAMTVLVLLEAAPVLQRPLEPVNIGLARATEWLLGQLGMPVARRGDILAHPDGFAYRITYVCSGLRPIALIAVTLLVVPASWPSRMWGLMVGVLGVTALNLCRLAHLYWTGVVNPDAFFMAHRVTWNIVAVGLVAGGLLMWLHLNGRSRGGRSRGTDCGPPGTAHAHG